MKEYMKMSDVFNGVVLNERSTIYILKSKGFTRGVEVFVNDVWASFNGHDGAAEHAAHAINSHDELVQMNKELLEALEAVIDDKAPSYHDCIDNGESECGWCIARNAIKKAKGGAA